MNEDIEHTTMIVRMSTKLRDRFDSLVEDKGLKRSEVIRMLMNEYIEKFMK